MRRPLVLLLIVLGLLATTRGPADARASVERGTAAVELASHGGAAGVAWLPALPSGATARARLANAASHRGPESRHSPSPPRSSSDAARAARAVRLGVASPAPADTRAGTLRVTLLQRGVRLQI